MTSLEEIEKDIYNELREKHKFCIVCHNPIPKRNLRFCSNKNCQKTFWKNKKQEEKETFPLYKCQFCGCVTQLTFDPRFKTGNTLLQSFVCGNCGKMKSNNK